MEAFGCFLNPGPCIDGAVASWVAWFPFGLNGVIFATGLIIGAILGKWGVAAVFALVLTLKVAGKTPHEPIEHVDGHDAAPPIPAKKKRKTIFN